MPAFASAWYGKIIRPSSWAAAFQFGFYELDLKKKKINQSISLSCLKLSSGFPLLIEAVFQPSAWPARPGAVGFRPASWPSLLPVPLLPSACRSACSVLRVPETRCTCSHVRVFTFVSSPLLLSHSFVPASWDLCGPSFLSFGSQLRCHLLRGPLCSHPL